MNEHPPVWPTIVALLSAALTIVLGWLQLAARREVDAVNRKADEADAAAEDARRDLEKHKLYAAEMYARKSEVKEELHAVERRLGEKLDEQKALLREIKAQRQH